MSDKNITERLLENASQISGAQLGDWDINLGGYVNDFTEAASEITRLTEVVERAKQEVQQYHDRETCMCGDYIKDHGAGSEHTPVSMYDYALDNARIRIKQADTMAKAAKNYMREAGLTVDYPERKMLEIALTDYQKGG